MELIVVDFTNTSSYLSEGLLKNGTGPPNFTGWPEYMSKGNNVNCHDQ